MVFEHEFDRLVRFRSTDAPVLSVYFDVPADPGELKGVHARVHSLLKPMHELATANELTHAARNRCALDIAKIEDLAERNSELLGRGVAVFACSSAGFYEEIVLAVHFRERSIADETPYLRPLLAAVSSAHRYLVVVVERGRSWFYKLLLQHLDEVDDIIEPSTQRPGRPSEHDHDQRHVQNRAETLARKHYRATAEAAEGLMQQTGAEFLIVGGHQETVAEFGEMLPKALQPRMVGTFVIDPKTMTLANVREHAQPIVDEYEREHEPNSSPTCTREPSSAVRVRSASSGASWRPTRRQSRSSSCTTTPKLPGGSATTAAGSASSARNARCADAPPARRPT